MTGCRRFCSNQSPSICHRHYTDRSLSSASLLLACCVVLSLAAAGAGGEFFHFRASTLTHRRGRGPTMGCGPTDDLSSLQHRCHRSRRYITLYATTSHATKRRSKQPRRNWTALRRPSLQRGNWFAAMIGRAQPPPPPPPLLRMRDAGVSSSYISMM